MNQHEIERLETDLIQFTGSDTFYKNPLFGHFVYTEGVKYLAEAANCYWLIDYIFSYQLDPILRKQAFQLWKLEVKESKAKVTIEDGYKNVIAQLAIDYTDFPLEVFTLWLVDKTLLLPSEY